MAAGGESVAAEAGNQLATGHLHSESRMNKEWGQAKRLQDPALVTRFLQ